SKPLRRPVKWVAPRPGLLISPVPAPGSPGPRIPDGPVRVVS
ncbi:hypothetical protein OV450_6355, partial [Actinobacteria bacterium OV450]